LFEAVGLENLAMLERGEIDLAQNLLHAVPPDDGRFGSHLLGPFELLAASQRSLPFGKRNAIEIARLAAYPLLVLDAGFTVRRTFDAACRLAGVKPRILFEGRAPHTLLALAQAGHGVAILPSVLQTHAYDLKIVRVTYRGRPLSEPLTVFWDKRRTLPRYAMAFCEMWAAYMREVFPIRSQKRPRSA
jgi:DNA-binding transcriptional LysR family regulator